MSTVPCFALHNAISKSTLCFVRELPFAYAVLQQCGRTVCVTHRFELQLRVHIVVSNHYYCAGTSDDAQHI